jgi:hypothetical protein
MDDFDRFLDLQLRYMLDPVVTTPAPPRRNRRPRLRQPIRAVAAPIELEAIPVVEPVAVTVPVASAQH